jgi:hypothetical protein
MNAREFVARWSDGEASGAGASASMWLNTVRWCALRP